MANKSKLRVALVRGNSLNEWEGALWEDLGVQFDVTAFCSKKNLYNTDNLNYPVKQLSCSSDNFIINNLNKYTRARFQKIYGLEQELNSFNIAHTAEIFYFYTTQAVRAKQKNKNLKVVSTVWDNSFGRFEYNYWPGFKIPPKYWRNKINAIIKENAKGVDLFLPITEYSKEMLLDYGVPENKIRVLTPAVLNKNTDSSDILEKFNLVGKKIYLMINRVVKEKGIYDVLYGWRMYIKINGDKTKLLVVIGDGSERDNLIRLAQSLGLKDSVVFIKHLSNQKVRQLYPFAQCVILGSIPTPLWQEQFGYVLAEAICDDCPVVSTYSGAIPEVVEDAGLLYSPGNPIELKNALFDLDNSELFSKLKSNCQRVKRKFSPETFKENLINIYNSLFND